MKLEDEFFMSRMGKHQKRKPLVKLGSSDYGDNVLNCPKCGEVNLHQEEVTIYNRKEDEPKCTRIHITHDWQKNDGKISINPKSKGKGNPSSRRQGLIITFSCEHCGSKKKYNLGISQHKGVTYFDWL